MFKRYLQKPLMILWIAIVALRIVLDEILLRTPHAGPWFDRVYAIFVLAVPIAEVFIFYRAFKAYSCSEVSIQAPKAGISYKVLLVVFLYGLTVGLWETRRGIIDTFSSIPSGRWIDAIGMAAGCGMNLLLSGIIIHQILAARTGRNQVAHVAFTQDQPR